MLLKEEPLKGPLKLTFSLATLCEKGQVPSVCLHVPRRNLPTNQDFNLKPAYKVLVLYNVRVCRHSLPGADGHFVRVMDVGASVTMVALAESIIVHAVLLGLLFLLFGLSYYS